MTAFVFYPTPLELEHPSQVKKDIRSELETLKQQRAGFINALSDYIQDAYKMERVNWDQMFDANSKGWDHYLTLRYQNELKEIPQLERALLNLDVARNRATIDGYKKSILELEKQIHELETQLSEQEEATTYIAGFGS